LAALAFPKKTKKPNFFGFFGFLQKTKKTWFFKMLFVSPDRDQTF
jgi:hypothetical protein